VRAEHLSPAILAQAAGPSASATAHMPLVVGDLRSAVESFERTAIDEALRRASGNKSRAAKELGISRFALQRKLEKYGLGTVHDPDDAAEVEPESAEIEAAPAGEEEAG
jgi:transcriptional regulator with PAS, ATPase and Fis domain